METKRPEKIVTFDFDNPITASLSKYDKAKQIYTEGPEQRVGEREIRGAQTEKESHRGYGGQQRLPLSPSVVLWRA